MKTIQLQTKPTYFQKNFLLVESKRNNFIQNIRHKSRPVKVKWPQLGGDIRGRL